MKPDAMNARFIARLAAAWLSLDAVTPATGAEAMLAYYAEERADGCPIESDGDMLLFEWGTHNWGDGPAFEVSICRQCIVSGTEDEEPWQFALTFEFHQSVGITAGEGNRWCASPDGLAEFRRSIGESVAMRVVGDRPPRKVSLRDGRA